MTRLDANIALSPAVERPAYDRAVLAPGIVHLGFGAFHRAHQAVYTDAAPARRFDRWGIVGVSQRSTAPVDDLRAEALRCAAEVARPGGDPTAPFFTVDGLFPEALARNRAWRDRVNQHVASALGRAVQ